MFNGHNRSLDVIKKITYTICGEFFKINVGSVNKHSGVEYSSTYKPDLSAQLIMMELNNL